MIFKYSAKTNNIFLSFLRKQPSRGQLSLYEIQFEKRRIKFAVVIRMSGRSSSTGRYPVPAVVASSSRIGGTRWAGVFVASKNWLLHSAWEGRLVNLLLVRRPNASSWSFSAQCCRFQSHRLADSQFLFRWNIAVETMNHFFPRH